MELLVGRAESKRTTEHSPCRIRDGGGNVVWIEQNAEGILLGLSRQTGGGQNEKEKREFRKLFGA